MMLFSITYPRQKRTVELQLFPLCLGISSEIPNADGFLHVCFWLSAIKSCSQISWQFELVYHVGVVRGNQLVHVLICFPSFRLPKMKLNNVVFGADVKEVHFRSSNPLCKLPGFSYLTLLMLSISQRRKIILEKTCHAKIYLSGRFNFVRGVPGVIQGRMVMNSLKCFWGSPPKRCLSLRPEHGSWPSILILALVFLSWRRATTYVHL